MSLEQDVRTTTSTPQRQRRVWPGARRPMLEHRRVEVACRRSGLVAATLAVTVVAACGGTSRTNGPVVTVPAYGEHPAGTVSGHASKVVCLQDAHAFARDAVRLLAHSGADAAYPADLYYVMVREDFADFLARRCDTKDLGNALKLAFTSKQRSALVADLPRAMAEIVRLSSR